MPLNVALVSEYYYPLLGGITENVHYTAKGLQARGHDVTIVTSHVTNGHVPPQLGLNGTRVARIGRSFRIPSNGSIARGTIGLHLFRDLRDFFHSHDFDIVHTHSPLVFSLPPIAVLAARSPAVGTFHTYFEASRVYERFHGLLQAQFLDRLHAVTAVSQNCLDSLARYFTLRDPRIIPNGVDVDAFHPGVARMRRFDRSKLTLLFLGRFDVRNGFPLMLAAFERVRRARHDVRLVVVGDGPLRARYERLVPPALRADVHFEGFAVATRPGYYATCDIFCSPVSKASFGITLLEAMASGKPIVASANVGYRELVGPEEAVLTPARDADAFATAVLELLDDPERRDAMGRAGREHAMAYSWDRVVEQTLDLYTEVLART